MMVKIYTLYVCDSRFATCDNKIEIYCITTLNNWQYLIIDAYFSNNCYNSNDGYILNNGYILNVTIWMQKRR